MAERREVNLPSIREELPEFFQAQTSERNVVKQLPSIREELFEFFPKSTSHYGSSENLGVNSNIIFQKSVQVSVESRKEKRRRQNRFSQRAYRWRQDKIKVLKAKAEAGAISKAEQCELDDLLSKKRKYQNRV